MNSLISRDKNVLIIYVVKNKLIISNVLVFLKVFYYKLEENLVLGYLIENLFVFLIFKRKI